MKKLIELLNEYEKSWLNEFELEKYVEWWYCEWNWRIFRGNWENNNELTPYELCSKHYWFIKRLVDNDKIDLLRLDNRIALSEFNKVERVLMALSISSSPIEDLISYLK
jgi:hypothetical protein